MVGAWKSAPPRHTFFGGILTGEQRMVRMSVETGSSPQPRELPDQVALAFSRSTNWLVGKCN
jgi:hypothetical protein